MTLIAKTAKGRVFEYLLQRLGEWVDGPGVLDTPEVGGSEGLRRLREAREDTGKKGYRIEGPRRNPNPNKAHTPQYRLVKVDDVAERYAEAADMPAGTKQYLCPRPTCAYLLSPPVASEFDEKVGFGECPIHNLQMVTL